MRPPQLAKIARNAAAPALTFFVTQGLWFEPITKYYADEFADFFLILQNYRIFPSYENIPFQEI